MSDPEEFRDLAADFKEILGRDWVDSQLDMLSKTRRTNLTYQGFPVIDGFGKVDDWVTALEEGVRPPDVVGMMKFATWAWEAVEGTKLPNGDGFADELRARAHAGQTDAFFDTLFEAEAALFFRERFLATNVRFGPPKGGKPDVWVDLPVGRSKVRIPVECKRIQASSSKDREVDRLAAEIDRRLQTVIDELLPIKVIIWLHRPVANSDARTLEETIRRLAKRILESEKDGWLTAAEEGGAYQVSVAALGQAAEFQSPGPVIPDVPARPVLIPRSQMRRPTEDRFEARMKSITSVQSDRPRDRVGNLRARVRKAARQLQESARGTVGCIAIRVRRPNGLGDIYENDEEVRSELARLRADHVGLVALFWGEDLQSEEEIPGQPEAKMVTAGHSLKPYFIANRRSSLRFDAIDSRKEHFPEEPDAVVRDHVTGELTKIDPAILAEVLTGADVPKEIIEAAGDVEELDEEAGAATIYLRLKEPLALNEHRSLVALIRAGERHFRGFIDKGLELRVLEVREALVVRVATVDLRAWIGGNELCFSVVWDPDGFQLNVVGPDETDWIKARSAFVPPPE